jgi:hypothetical protein
MRWLCVNDICGLKVAEQEWRESRAVFQETLNIKEKQVLDVRNEIYQLVGFFSAFQGLLFTAVAQSSLLHCGNQWCPLALSIFASFVTVAGVQNKNGTTKELQETIHMLHITRQVSLSLSLSPLR